MTTENKYAKLAFQIFTLLCVTAAGICILCDFALNKGMTWSWYPIITLPFAWVLATPMLLAKKNNIAPSLIALSAAILPFLYLLDLHTPAKGWFMALGVPLAATSIVALWLMYFLVRIIKNKWYLSAFSVFLFGVVVATTVKYFVSSYTGGTFLSLDNAINFIACSAVTVLLVIIGNFKRQNEKLEDDIKSLQCSNN